MSVSRIVVRIITLALGKAGFKVHRGWAMLAVLTYSTSSGAPAEGGVG